MTGPFRNKLRLVDNDLLKDLVPKKILSIGLQPDGFVFCILDTDQFRFMALEHYVFEHKLSQEELFQSLHTLIKEHPLLGMTFERVCISVYSPRLVLIPNEIFHEDEKDKLFGFCTPVQPGEQLITDRLNILKAHALYMVPVVIHNLAKLFKGHCQIRHEGSVLIENVLASQRLENWQSDIVLRIKPEHCDIIVLKKKKLQFYQSFGIQTFEDILYYLFFVLNEFELDAASLKLMLVGDAAMDSETYASLTPYFKEVAIPQRNDMFRYSPVLDQVPYHFYYNLFNMVTCGS